MTRRSSEAQRFQMPAVEAKVQAAILAPIGDATSRHGAEKLKKNIEDAWRKRGQTPPRIEIVEKLIRIGGDTIKRFELQSNMKNGKPVGRASA